MSIVSAGTLANTAYVVTADTNGNLVFKTGASSTTALTLGSDQSAAFAGTVTMNGRSYTWPASYGTSGQFLQTNGSGTLSWASVQTGAQDYVLMFSYGIV